MPTSGDLVEPRSEAIESRVADKVGGQVQTLSDEDVERARVQAVEHQLRVNSTWYRERGNKAFSKREYAKAVDLYTQGIRNTPTSKIFCNRSLAHLKLGKPAEAHDDACLALLVDPASVKAFVRRSVSWEALGDFGKALEDIERALVLEPSDPDLSRIRRRLEECHTHWSRGKRLEERVVDAAAREEMKEVRDLKQELDFLKSAVASEGAQDASKVADALKRVKGLTETQADCRDYLLASDGLSVVAKAFKYDNGSAVAILHAAVRSLPAVADFFVREEWFEVIAASIHSRRVKIVSTGLEIVSTLIDRVPSSRAQLIDSRAFPILLLMYAKGTALLLRSCASIVARMAHMKQFHRAVMDHQSSFKKGLHRCCTSDDDGFKAAALATLVKIAGSKALLSILSTPEMADAMTALLARALSEPSLAANADPREKFVPFAFDREQLEQLGEILSVTSSLTLTLAFVEGLEKAKAWPLLVPMMRIKSDVQTEAVEVLVSASRSKPELSTLLLNDKMLFRSLIDAFTDVAHPTLQKKASHLALLLCNLPEFTNQLAASSDLTDLHRMLSDRLPDITHVAVCRILFRVAKATDAFRDALCGNGALLERLVSGWYGRGGYAKQASLVLIQLLLSEEKGSKTLSARVSEGQLRVLIQDLSRHNAMAEAVETGGANLFAPPIENDLFSEERARLVASVDTRALITYLGTLFPAGRDKILVDIGAASGMLCTTLAGAMADVAVYAVDWFKGLTQRVEQAASKANTRNVYPVCCGLETVNEVPVTAGICLLIGLWKAIEDPPRLFNSVRNKLNRGGLLVLAEEEAPMLEDAKGWARKAGFHAIAEPKHIKG